MKKIILYTDGACSGNPGPGGYGSVIMYKDAKKEISGYMPNTTNNQMEMLAVIEGIKLLKEPCEVEIYSDSAYVVNAFKNKWVDSWIKNNWKTSSKGAVKNVELWKELLDVLKDHKYKFIKVKGHADNEYNNRCDELARKAITDNN